MTASIAILCAAVVIIALVVRDVFVRALSTQVRKAELAVEQAREAEISAVAKRVEALEVELHSVVSAIQLRKAAGR